MPARRNVTVNCDVDVRIEKTLPSKRINALVDEAVRSPLFLGRPTLEQAYKAASRERWRRRRSADWRATENEGWSD